MARNGRPAGVTVVAVIAWLSGALQIGLGLLVLAGILNPVGVALPAIWLMIAIGTVTLLVSFGLLGGSAIARVLVTISLSLSLVNAFVQAAVQPAANALAASIITATLAVVGLALLYTARANRFFD